MIVRGQQILRRGEEVEGGGRIEEVPTSPTMVRYLDQKLVATDFQQNPADRPPSLVGQTQSHYSSLAGWNDQGAAPTRSMNVQAVPNSNPSFVAQQLPSTSGASLQETDLSHCQPPLIYQPTPPPPQQSFQGTFSSHHTAQNPYQSYYQSQTHAPALPNAQMHLNTQPMPAVPQWPVSLHSIPSSFNQAFLFCRSTALFHRHSVMAWSRSVRYQSLNGALTHIPNLDWDNMSSQSKDFRPGSAPVAQYGDPGFIPRQVMGSHRAAQQLLHSRGYMDSA